MDLPVIMHLALCRFPAIGLLIAVFILAVGLIVRSRRVHRTGLVVTFTMCLLVPFIMKSGGEVMEGFQKGEIQPPLDEVGIRWMEVHRERADHGAAFLYVLALVSGVALYLSFRASPYTAASLLATVILCFTATILTWRISSAGGKIRHPEARDRVLPAEHFDR